MRFGEMMSAVWEAVKAALARPLMKLVRRGGRWVWEASKATAVGIGATVLQAPAWVAANLTAPFRAQNPQAPSPGQGQVEGQKEIHERLLAETPEARAAAELAVQAERLRSICRRLADGSDPARLHTTIGRLPAPWQLWLRSLTPDRLAAAAAMEPAALLGHMTGEAPVEGLPSLEHGAEAARLGVQPESLQAARSIEAWRARRGERPGADRRPRRGVDNEPAAA